MVEYILAALQSVDPDAKVRSYPFDGGSYISVVSHGRRVFISAEYGDNPETILAAILDRLSR